MYIDSPDTFYTTDDTIGGRISLARDANGLSVEAAALAIGIAAGTWIDWENDRDAPFPRPPRDDCRSARGQPGVARQRTWRRANLDHQ
ncbi:hypothetical protein ACOJBM_42395 [Rhizobium beringeri]